MQGAARIRIELMTKPWLLLVRIIAIAAAALILICSPKKRQKQSREFEAHSKAIEEQGPEVTQEAGRAADEAQRPLVEPELRQHDTGPTGAEQQHNTSEEIGTHHSAAQLLSAEEESKSGEEESQQDSGKQHQVEECQAAEGAQPVTAGRSQPKEAESSHIAAQAQQAARQESKSPEAERPGEGMAWRRITDEELVEPPAKAKRPEPGKRGGRPRSGAKAEEKMVGQPTEPRRQKPEIICWKRERQWIPVVELPEELFESRNLVVVQNGLRLIQDESNEGCWQLREAYGQVLVRWEEDELARETKVALGEERYLLFKLSGRDQNQGRRVKSPSSGWYLVMVPDNWERDDTDSGPAPVAPEPVSLAGYKAHYFQLDRDGGGKIALRAPTGEPFVIESKAPQFELVGNRLYDASESVGPLFGERSPAIRALDTLTWKDVRTIVVGEEGSKRGRWRKAFSPTLGQIQQPLPLEVAARQGGWYFLRFYDTNDDLVESLDFRFLCALKEIRIHQPPPVPSEDGHSPVQVEFLHEPRCAVRPVDGPAHIQIERQDDKTILTIPPDPACDESHWLVGPEAGPQVQVTILVERLWWTVGEEHNAPTQWRDKPFALTRDDFAATSTRALWIRLPKARWVDKVFVGFDRTRARPYPVKVADSAVAIPLRDFSDCQEIGGIGIIPLMLWIVPEGAPSYQSALCELRIKLHCKSCCFETLSEQDIYSHIKSYHLGNFFRPLTYEELSRRISSLPYKIYQCSYCKYYVESNDFNNPTSAICKHIEKYCTKAPRGMGPSQIWFRVIYDPDEIRQNVIHSLPHVYKCLSCGYVFENPTDDQMISHLIERHRNILFERL